MEVAAAQNQPDERIGRYAIFGAIAQGGMARVHLARLMGPEGFSRVVAIKRMHAQFLEDPEFKQMFVAEARLAARVRHPNVVPVLDVLTQSGELLIVMEYVHGESLQALLRAIRGVQASIPLPIACSIMLAALQGIHAAHEARNEKGELLNLVHRDVSPHNVLVGADGVTRVLDFGVAKAVQAQEAKPGMLKGKFSYMAPEVIGGASATRQSDIFSAAAVFWELLTGRKLFGGSTERERVMGVLQRKYPSPREIDPSIPVTLDCIVMKGLEQDPARRYLSASDMAIAIERHTTPTSQRVIGEWVSDWAAEALNRRAELIHQIETSYVSPHSSDLPPPLVSEPPLKGRDSERTTAEVLRNIPRRLWLMGAVGLALASAVAWFASSRSPSAAESPGLGVPSKETQVRETGTPPPTVMATEPPIRGSSEAPAGPAAPPAAPATTRSAQAPEARPAGVTNVGPDETRKRQNGNPIRPEERAKVPASAKDYLPDEL